jgi:HEAT repeat protein
LAGFDSAAINAARLKQRIKFLLVNLNSFNPDDRRNAAEALGKIGPEAKEVVPALSAALNDQDEMVRRYAASALKTIQPENEHLLPT